MIIAYLTQRELLQTGLFIGDLFLVIVLSMMLARAMRYRGWLLDTTNKVIMWLLVHFVGMTISRAWGSVLLWVTERGGDLAAVENAYPVSMVGQILSAIGVLGLVSVFLPKIFGLRSWLVALVLAAGLTGMIWAAFNVHDESAAHERARIESTIRNLLHQGAEQ